MNFSMKGYGENTATFRTDGVVCVSHTVKMADNLTVAPCEAGDAFIGAAVNARNDYACVQLDGYVTLTYTGDAPAVGYCPLASDGNGGVMIAEGSREYLVTDVDTVNKTAGIIL